MLSSRSASMLPAAPMATICVRGACWAQQGTIRENGDVASTPFTDGPHRQL